MGSATIGFGGHGPLQILEKECLNEFFKFTIDFQ